MMRKITISLTLLLLFVSAAFSQQTDSPRPLAFEKGKLVYSPDESGNRIPDFSYSGYMAGDRPIPDTPVKAVVTPMGYDATEAIQQAIDYVAGLKPDKDGFRGAVLLQAGDYKVGGDIVIKASGVVLRGSGVNKTRIVATGKDRRTLIRILGKNDITEKNSINITGEYVPVNSFTVTLPADHGLKPGDNIFIERPSTKEWIDVMGTNHFGGGITALGWKPGDYNLKWDRVVVAVNGSSVTFDVPITTALEKKYGGGVVIPYLWAGRITNVGVENLSCISEYDANNPKDEAHAWGGISIENTADAWVSNITFENFAGSAVAVWESSKRVTVENCKSLNPVSEIGGWRRYTFFTSGGQTLFQRLHAENGYHDFAVGSCAPGPNAFVQCHSALPYSFSGAIGSWASGVLFDVINVDGNALSYKNRWQEAQGAGWSAANSVFWQCTASLMECFAPPTAMNWAFGSWSEFSGDGYWTESNNHITPRSLYYQQLKERLGAGYSDDREQLLPVPGEASTSPTVAAAAELTKIAYSPPVTLAEWIDGLTAKYTEPKSAGAKIFNNSPAFELSVKYPELRIVNGWIVRDGEVQTGGKQEISYWNGSVNPSFITRMAKPHVTRFVPGRSGFGLTDNIADVAAWMKSRNILALDHNYGLWYERRRDDHERIRRINGEVWAPFYEQPFARSGEGRAYDGLSKYDLTKFNHWYWMRLRQFADEADRSSLVLLHQNYFQHNIIEAGAHWADSPWRPANNINNTGFPEPAPYAGDKRIFLAEQFYNVNHPVRRELHRRYIRQCLDNFKGSGSVIQLLSAEYTGPADFVMFWLDVIAEWEAETGQTQLVALSATKDVQDKVLADPVRSKVVDVIDIRYWFYRNNGSEYAPLGGQNLAPRQHARLVPPGTASFASVYRAVEEYRARFPEKAVTYYSDSYPQNAWAVFMATGSLASIPVVANPDFKKEASKMSVMKSLNKEGQYVLGNSDRGFIVYSDNKAMTLDLTGFAGKYTIYWIDPHTGAVTGDKKLLTGGKPVEIQPVTKVLWLVKSK